MSNMDIDEHNNEFDHSIRVHPLALVSMADQFTRVRCGGSPLNKDSPVVGLLFGTQSATAQREITYTETIPKRMVLAITDAEDIPVDSSEAAQNQIHLHQAVFPLHNVVGWYRVTATDDQPQLDDVQRTTQLQTTYQKPLLFGLLQVPSETTNVDEELPLSLYRLDDTVLLHISHWTLYTAIPERVAVERVVRQQPVVAAADHSIYTHQIETIQSSLAAIRSRIHILVLFLQNYPTMQPPRPDLLRNVQKLLLQLGPVQATSATTKTKVPDDLLSTLAIVTKTVQAVQSYTDKFRAVHHDSTIMTGGARSSTTRKDLRYL